MTVPRGPDEVRAALVDAASALLGEKPPQRITGRELAKRAGVNYGLVHHYFGGKSALLSEGLAHLAASYALGERADGKLGDWRPSQPFSIRNRPDYLRAIAFASIAGEMGKVSTIHPVVEASLAEVADRRGCGEEPTDETRVDVAVATMFQLGWCLFAEMVTGGLELDSTERDEVEARLRLVLRAVLLGLDVGEAARGILESEGT